MLKTLKISKLNKIFLVGTLALSSNTFAGELGNTKATVEELRIPTAVKAMPTVAGRLAARIDAFAEQINKAKSYTVLTQLVLRHAPALWNDAKKSFITLGDYDDRPLYWSRLKMSKILRSSEGFAKLFPNQQQKLLWTLELLSRGQSDVKFDKKADKKILITGFDPFFLDRNIDQSNPSGVVALSLDDIVLSVEGKTAEVEVLIVPVRFADFDQGMIEELLTPYIAEKNVDMVITVSMGRENFDLERYPALRRSAKAPDNLNVLTGATKNKPLVPKLKSNELKGPEFVEFSLPVDAMKNGSGKYQVNDNRNISTLEKTYAAQSLAEIVNKVSVNGSGGGYLSNEISYRSILLREKYNPLLPVGHIHTPRIKSFDQQALMDIVNQTKNIITQGVAEL
jgi:pyrrolidone-carboxylate peptidase